MSVKGGPNTVTSGLVLELDAGNIKSYPGSGTTWYDKSGYANNGELTNGPTFDTSSGGSIVFDGSNDYVNRNSSLNVGSNFSVFAWVKPGNINIRNAIVGNSYPYTGREGFLFATGNNYGTSTNTFFISIGSDAAYGTAVNNTVTINQWNYLGGVVTNGGGDFKLYVNGIQVNLNPGSLLTSGTITYNTNEFLVGARRPSSETWIGNIALTQLYNRSLSDPEVLQNFNATKTRFGIQ
jgi:hypothetical protein